MSMEIATRFITLRESGEDTAALALLTDNATLGTVWGCIAGKEAIANYFKDEKRFNYLKKQYGPLKQKTDNIVEREGIAYLSSKWHVWTKEKVRESYVINLQKGRIKAFVTHRLK